MSFRTLESEEGYAKETVSNLIEVIGDSRGTAPSLSNIDGSKSIIANTLLDAASPFCNWLSSIPRINIGIVILVEISKKVTNWPTVISSDAIIQPPADTRRPKEIPATTYMPGMNRFLINAA